MIVDRPKKTRSRSPARSGLRALRTLCLAAALLLLAVRSLAQSTDGRAAALDYLGRGTAAFRAGNTAGAVANWSEAIRLARLAGAADIEVQAMVRRGEAYRVDG